MAKTKRKPCGARALSHVRRRTARSIAGRDREAPRRHRDHGSRTTRWHRRLRSSRSLVGRGPPPRRARHGTREVSRRGRGGASDDRRAAPQAAALSARRRGASRFRGTRATRRRDGTRQDGAGDCRLRAAAPSTQHRPRPGRVPGLAQGRMARSDRALPRRRHVAGDRSPRHAPRGLCAAGFLHDRQLRASRGGRGRYQPARQARYRHPRRGAAHQELAYLVQPATPPHPDEAIK